MLNELHLLFWKRKQIDTFIFDSRSDKIKGYIFRATQRAVTTFSYLATRNSLGDILGRNREKVERRNTPVGFSTHAHQQLFRLHANTFQSLEHLAHYWCSAGAKSAVERCMDPDAWSKREIGPSETQAKILNKKWNWLEFHVILSSPMRGESPLDNEFQTQNK